MRGFTLIELAVVIAIVGLLLGGLLVPLAAQLEGQKIKKTQQSLMGIKNALTGFAVTQGRLPCPDTDGDGIEDRAGVPPFTCDAFANELPYETLSVPPFDMWGSRFEYQVTQEFTYQAQTGMPAGLLRLDLKDIGDLTAKGRNSNYVLIDITTNSPAIVKSTQDEALTVWLSPYTLISQMVTAGQLP